MRRARAFSLLVLLSFAGLALATHTLAAGQGPAPIVGTMRATARLSFEPTVGVDSMGNVYITGESYTGSLGQKLIYKSIDDGRTWSDVTMRLGPVSVSPVNNDPYLFVDDTDRVFHAPNQGTVCTAMAFSDDGAQTWTLSTVGCGHPVGGHDHQTVWSAKPRTVQTQGYPNVIYYCVNRVADTACATSLDGGVTFGVFRSAFVSGPVPSPATIPALCLGGLMGHGASGPDGTAFIAKERCGFPTVAITRDDGATWTHSRISSTSRVYGHDVEIAVDSAGTVYAAWIGATNRLPMIAVSHDGGTTWGPARVASPPGVGAADFVDIAAGDAGRIVVSYMGTAASKPYGSMTAVDTWNGYLGISLDAASASPTFTTVTVNDPADPLARGACGGSRCSGVGDFLDVVIDGEGRPWSALVDVCNAQCVSGVSNSGAIGGVGTLASGPRLRGTGDLPALR